MSTLSQFAPFAGGGLKSFQTGYVSVSPTSSGSGEDTRFTDVTISSVSTSKAIPCFYGMGMFSDFGPYAVYYWASGATATPAWVFPRLTSSTNLRLSVNFNTADAFGGGNTRIMGRWQVAEAN